jgi:hypothetical protein
MLCLTIKRVLNRYKRRARIIRRIIKRKERRKKKTTV